ncbi:histidine--tRNA ligase [Candidatus Saccharibacteria bacterium]|nr:histidine--tRNA ligase [Candidatus Saccharibacteria bacterium]
MQIKHQPYKGVRDFYPEDWRLQAYIFKVWAEVAESYGYERYDASVLEYLELYRLKSQGNSEILNEQIYSFVDRGQRQVALRPEMTPTVARMIAARRQELGAAPIRWYSIPNVFRYERPQKGRLREHWQLNVDCFGVPPSEAELELILIACDVLKRFKAAPNMYVIKLSSRRLLEDIFRDQLGLNRVQIESLFLLFDRHDKMGKTAFGEACRQLLPPEGASRRKGFAKLQDLINCQDLTELPADVQDLPSARQLGQLLGDLRVAGITNAVLDFKIVRGFDYYTDIVFEIFDQEADNRRSMFGGGRYDGLLESLGVEPLSGAGFGMGDVTTADFLAAHRLLPAFKPAADICVILLEDAPYIKVLPVLRSLRAEGFNPVVDNRPAKAAKKIEAAVKRRIEHALFIGPADLEEERFNLKHLPSGKEDRLSLARVISRLAERK